MLTRSLGFIISLSALSTPVFSSSTETIEVHMKLPASSRSPAVALTLDACGGGVDSRILNALIKERIPAVVFVTGIWLRKNESALRTLKAHPDLFEIENHGARHVPAVDRQMTVYGIQAAGSSQAVRSEVIGGSQAIFEATGRTPRWFRGATARYSRSSIATIQSMGVRVAGFSISADGGGTLGREATKSRILSARNRDVILAHINRPDNPAGQGVVDGIIALKAKGYRFVKLNGL